MKITTLKDTSSYKVFEVTIEAEKAKPYFTKAAAKLSQETPLKGFRPGHTPFEALSKELSKHTVARAVAQEVLHDALPEFFKAHAYHRLGEPMIEFKKIEQAKPILFTVSIALWPTFTLGAYKEITVKEEKVVIEDKEIANALDYLKKARNASTLNDDFARSLGNFKNLDELKVSIKEGIRQEKTLAQKEKTRGDMLENIRKTSPIELAPFLIDKEAQKIIEYQAEQMKASGMELKQYLTSMHQTQEEFVQKAKDMAQKRIQNTLILNEIAKKENITISDSDVEARATKALSHFKSPQEAQEELGDYSSLQSRLHQQLLQEKVFADVLDKQILTEN